MVKLIAFLCLLVAVKAEVRKFPDGLSFGVATASYQIEGGWNASDKGENIWDYITHNTKIVMDGSNGDIACDSYHLYKQDVKMVEELGVDFYRFSISWSRILPNGFTNKLSDDGIAYYNSLIDELLKVNITPAITLFHWDLPLNLQALGGWSNPLMIDYYADFVLVAFKHFGDRVKTWITFNEPWIICFPDKKGVGNAPDFNMTGVAEYICAHNVIKAHALVYHLYSEIYKPTQKGRIGWALNSNWYEPATQNPDDVQAAENALQLRFGWFGHPVFSRDGDYPQVMKDIIANRSSEEGYPRSRLPEFTDKEIVYIRGTYDFVGLNHYTTSLVKKSKTANISNGFEDLYIETYDDPKWPSFAAPWIKLVPWGFRNLLNWIRINYYNPEIIVFENGVSDNDMNDIDRINYIKQYLNALLDAIDDGCNISGYTIWSLMDDFEWHLGYTQKFGLYHVDFNDPNRTRTPKASALYFKSILETRTLELN